jgi:hypothetical protein
MKSSITKSQVYGFTKFTEKFSRPNVAKTSSTSSTTSLINTTRLRDAKTNLQPILRMLEWYPVAIRKPDMTNCWQMFVFISKCIFLIACFLGATLHWYFAYRSKQLSDEDVIHSTVQITLLCFATASECMITAMLASARWFWKYGIEKYFNAVVEVCLVTEIHFDVLM